jgi:hypothetical protein
MQSELKGSERNTRAFALAVVLVTLAVLLLGCGLSSAVLAHGALFPGAIVSYFRPSAGASCVKYARTSGQVATLCAFSIGASMLFTSQAPPVQVFAWYDNKFSATRIGNLSILTGSILDERNNPQAPPVYPLVLSMDLSLDGLP